MKRKFLTGALTLLVVALAVAGALLLWQSRKLDDYTAQLSLGDKYLEELDYENAEIAYKKAIEIDEKRASAYVNLSVVYVKQNRFAEARELLAEAEEKVSGEQALQAVQEQLSRVEPGGKHPCPHVLAHAGGSGKFPDKDRRVRKSG